MTVAAGFASQSLSRTCRRRKVVRLEEQARQPARVDASDLRNLSVPLLRTRASGPLGPLLTAVSN